MAIKEPLNMDMPSLQELFRNLDEHEMELRRFTRNDDDRKMKSLDFKAIVNFYDDEDDLESFENLKKDEELSFLKKKNSTIFKIQKSSK